MLAFNILGGGRSDTNRFKAFTKAISETIELSCNVKHPGLITKHNFSFISDGDEIYRRFWISLFNWFSKGNKLPTIITFNYDLVLERSLFQTLINKYYQEDKNRAPFNAFTIDYKYRHFEPEHYRLGYIPQTFTPKGEYGPGSNLEKMDTQKESSFANIELLKLHGSLNFPTSISQLKKEKPTLTKVIENPYILPPVSNKHSNGAGDESWQVALNRLREAKNVIFVGYSLPKTDMYMQFFLKAALGPNQELNKLYVFDPVLWQETEASLAMRSRFEACFAEQLRPRINFNPPLNTHLMDCKGTTEHFVNILENDPEWIFF
jgi:hypothetical protein